jgi:hypothetical protein
MTRGRGKAQSEDEVGRQGGETKNEKAHLSLTEKWAWKGWFNF